MTGGSRGWSPGQVARRILFSTWPAHGHLLPLLPMARAALAAGHEVVIASGAEGAAEAARRGFAVWDVGPGRDEAGAAFAAVVPDIEAIDPAVRIPTLIAGVFGAAALRRAEDLVPRAEAWQPDLVVHPITELAGAVAAERVGAPRLVHGFGPLPAEAWSWFGARFGDLCEAWDVPELLDGILDSPFVELCPPSLQRDAVAAFTHRIPMRPGSGDVAPGERLPWSAEQLAALPHPDTVHLTLGTLFHSATHVFTAALAGLAELPVNVLVTVGPGADPAALGPRPPHVLVADFVPHELLLPHCTAIISQGGPATILAALDHGLPHLVLPQGADQFMNAPVLVDSGAGLALMPPEVTAERVAEATSRLLAAPGFAAATARMQAELATMPTADVVLEQQLAALTG
jgi:UDP:flavonoid glycosyltransferase YjiC (YdhE family)